MKLSIIIPTHNRSSHCKRLVKTLPKRKYIEIIFVENGSSEDELISYSKIEMPPNYKLVHSLEKGVSSARNRGIDISRGEYIYFMDDDDELSKSGYKILDTLSFSAGISKYEFSWSGKDKFYSRKFLRTARQNLSVSTWIIPRSLLINNKIRFAEGITYGEDQLFGYFVLKKSSSINYRKESMINPNPYGEETSITRGIKLSLSKRTKVLELLGNDRAGRILKRKIMKNIRNEDKNG